MNLFMTFNLTDEPIYDLSRSSSTFSRRSNTKSMSSADPDLEVGSVVEVTPGPNNPPLYGVIRWIGQLKESEIKDPKKVIAGLEMVRDHFLFKVKICER